MSTTTRPRRTLRAGREGRRRFLRLLLAEDNAVNQRLAVSLLEKRGHQVVVAGNGREALAALDGTPFDAVLMDVQMPEMDGFEATAVIRAREEATGAHLPIIAMTAHALKGDRERCLEAGMDGYVTKPLRPQELFRVLEGLAPATDEAEATPPPRPTALDDAFDLAAALDRMDGDVELLKELAGLFLDDCPGRMAEIRQAIDREMPGASAGGPHPQGVRGQLRRPGGRRGGAASGAGRTRAELGPCRERLERAGGGHRPP